MNHATGQDSGIISLLSDFADLLIANILWLITSIPLVTLGASTAALYSVMRSPSEKCYRSSIVLNFFAAFGKNFKKATLALLVLLIPGALVLVNAFVLIFGLLETSIVGYVICGLSILLFFFLWTYAFPLIATFDNTVFKSLANALILSVAHLPTTIVVTVLNLIPLLILVFFTNFFFRTIILWVFVALALIAKVNSLLLERVFRRYIPAHPEPEA